MTNDDSGVVVVMPDDDVAAIIEKIRSTGTSQVSLLVTGSMKLLQQPANWADIQRGVAAEAVTPLIISTDPEILRAARHAGVETMGVADTPSDPVVMGYQRPTAAADASSVAVAGAAAVAQDAPPSDFQRRLQSRAAELTAGGDETQPTAPSSSVLPFNPRLILVPMIILLLIGIFFLLMQDMLTSTASNIIPPAGPLPQVQVTLPSPPSEAQPIEAEPIAVSSIDTEPSDVAVQADQLTVTVVYTQTGQVEEETFAPAGVARGVINLVNLNSQSISFPEGTEFIGVNPAGREVVFVADSGFVLPGSSQSRQGAQIITTLGQAQMTITARTPGSGSNLPAGSIAQIVIPGQGGISVNAGSIELSHGPISGGTEEPIRVVKDNNVEAQLSPALTSYYNSAQRELEARAAAANLVLETRTISPTADMLGKAATRLLDPDIGDPGIFDLRVIPPIGETVDPAAPSFFVVVEGEFSALTTPLGASLQEQIQRVFPNHLADQGRIPRGMNVGITGLQWDGTMLTVDGVLEPIAGPIQLSPQEQTEIADMIRGKTRAEAIAVLDEYVERGWIASYSLPEELEELPADTSLVIVENESDATPVNDTDNDE